MRSRQVSDKPWMRDQARPRAADGEHDLANAHGIRRESDGRERSAVNVEKSQIGPGVASNHASGDLAIGGSGTNLIIRVEQVIRDEKRLWVDDGAARGASATAAEEDHARCGPRGGAGEVV